MTHLVNVLPQGVKTYKDRGYSKTGFDAIQNLEHYAEVHKKAKEASVEFGHDLPYMHDDIWETK